MRWSILPAAPPTGWISHRCMAVLYAAARLASNDPAIRQDEALARLLASDFMNGWPLYESRLEQTHQPYVHTRLVSMWNLQNPDRQETPDRRRTRFRRYDSILPLWRIAGTAGRRTDMDGSGAPATPAVAANLPGEVLTEGAPTACDGLLGADVVAAFRDAALHAAGCAALRPISTPADRPELPGAAKPGRKIGLV